MSRRACCLALGLFALAESHLRRLLVLRSSFHAVVSIPFVCFSSFVCCLRNGALLSGLLSPACELLPTDVSVTNCASFESYDGSTEVAINLLS